MIYKWRQQVKGKAHAFWFTQKTMGFEYVQAMCGTTFGQFDLSKASPDRVECKRCIKAIATEQEPSK